MHRLIILAGAALASYLLFQFNNGEILTVDILSEMRPPDAQVEEIDVPRTMPAAKTGQVPAERDYLDKVLAMVGEVNSFDDDVVAAILPSDMSMARYSAEYLMRLNATQDVERFVVVAEGDVGKFVEMIGRIFPKSEVNVVAPGEELRGDVVIGVTGFVEGAANRGMVEFHDELTRGVFENFDPSGIERMDVENPDVVRAVMEYAESKGAEATEILKNGQFYNRSYFLVNFYDGEAAGEDRDLTILAFGDIMLGRYVRTLMDRNSMDYVFENMPEGFIGGADIVHANLEGPIKGKGRSGGTAMVFQFNEDVAEFIKKWGLTLVSLANNHAADAGWDGRETTIEALDEAGVDWCGHPRDVDAESVYYGEAGGKTYAFVCFHDVTFKLDDDAAVRLIEEIEPDVDYVVVSIHWGYEYAHTPHDIVQVERAHRFVDAGADFIIGHHPHVVQSFEIYNGVPIFYSLGNFVFDQYWSTETQEELSIGIVLGEQIKIYLFPMKSEKSQSRLMTERERDSWIEEFIGYADYDEEMKEMIRSGVISVL